MKSGNEITTIGTSEVEVIKHRIYEVRGLRVMLDRDLAELYGVETRALNQAVKRNIDRFPDDFLFRLNKNEWTFLKSQIVISNTDATTADNKDVATNGDSLKSQFVISNRGGDRALPYALSTSLCFYRIGHCNVEFSPAVGDGNSSQHQHHAGVCGDTPCGECMARGEPEGRAAVAQGGPAQQLCGGNPARPERHQPHAGGNQQRDSTANRSHQRCPRPTTREIINPTKTDRV